MSPEAANGATRVALEIWSRAQITIHACDEKGVGHGYRITGPKFLGAEVKLYEDGDRQEDGSVLWSGCAAGDCEVCGQAYADWWEGTFKIGEPSGRATKRDGLSAPPAQPTSESNVADR